MSIELATRGVLAGEALTLATKGRFGWEDEVPAAEVGLYQPSLVTLVQEIELPDVVSILLPPARAPDAMLEMDVVAMLYIVATFMTEGSMQTSQETFAKYVLDLSVLLDALEMALSVATQFEITSGTAVRYDFSLETYAT